MAFEKELSELNRMRLLDAGGIELYEDILNQISLKADNSIISSLCSIFEDEVWEPSVGDYLIKTIFYIAERCDLAEGMFEFAKGVPKMIPQGRDWAIIVHKTILSSELLIESYISAIKKIDNKTKNIIVNILNEVKNDEPKEYSEKVNKIVSMIEI
ncbi:MAG: Imm30 family immunity protein [Cellulosilyticaceae bacterium]